MDRPWAKEQGPHNDNMEKYDKLLSEGTFVFPTEKNVITDVHRANQKR